MDIETLGFVIGLVGAVVLKSSMNLMNDRPYRELREAMGRGPEDRAIETFLRGLALVMIGLGLETYARLFSAG